MPADFFEKGHLQKEIRFKLLHIIRCNISLTTQKHYSLQHHPNNPALSPGTVGTRAFLGEGKFERDGFVALDFVLGPEGLELSRHLLCHLEYLLRFEELKFGEFDSRDSFWDLISSFWFLGYGLGFLVQLGFQLLSEL